MATTASVLRLGWIVLSLLSLTKPALAQCQDWDGRFHYPGGVDSPVSSMTVFDDGGGRALYVGGQFSYAGGHSANHVAKWTGTGWVPLGGGVPGYALALAGFDDGSGPALYAAGTSSFPYWPGHVSKWDGASWSEIAGGPSHTVYALAAFDDGTGPGLYAGGYFSSPGSSIAKWDGSSWSPLGSGVSFTGSPGAAARVHAMAVFDDGTGPALYVAGVFDTAGSVPARSIARWDGTSWSALGSGIYGGMYGTAYALGVFDDGSGPALFAGGDFTNAGGVSANYIAKWDGTSWSPLGSGITGSSFTGVGALAVHDDGSGPALYAGGRFDTAGGSPANSIARWDGMSWSALGAGIGMDPIAGIPPVMALAHFDAGGPEALYVGGSFHSVAGEAMDYLAKWRPGAWSPIAPDGAGLDDDVRAFANYDRLGGPSLYAGGTLRTAGGVACNQIARWDGSSWSALGAQYFGESVEALVGFDDGTGPALYAGGSFYNRHKHVAKWDGQTWSALGSGLNSRVLAMTIHDDGGGAALYAGGWFTHTADFTLELYNIAKWDGSGWHPLGNGLNSPYCMVSFDDGTGPALYVGGAFSQAGGNQNARCIARWNGTSWSALASGLDGEVAALVVFDDGSGPALYAGGNFTLASGAPANHVAKWNGTAWFALGSGTDAYVKALRVWDDGSGLALFAAGAFTSAGGAPASHIAKWNGQGWSALGPGIGGMVNALEVFDDGVGGGPDLYAGGDFTLAGGLVSDFIAQRRGCSEPTSSMCFGDGSQAACPCGNRGEFGRGCENSASTGGARLGSSGTMHPDALVLNAMGERATALSIFLQGSVNVGPLVFGDGLRCAGGVLKRLYVTNAIGGSTSAPSAGDLPITARSAVLGDPIAPGSVRFYQTYYRDANPAFCPSPAGATFNASNGVRVLW